MAFKCSNFIGAVTASKASCHHQKKQILGGAYKKLTAIFIEVMKEQERQIEALQQKIGTQKKVEEIKAALNKTN